MKELFTIENPKLRLIGKAEDDRMKLFLDAQALEPGLVTRKELVEALAPQVKIDDAHIGVIDSIAEALSKAEKVSDRRIARGTPPQPGIDGKLLLLVKKFTGSAGSRTDGDNSEKELGQLSNLHLFDNIRKGQSVARIYPPHPGVAGVDALAKPIAATDGKPLKIEFDKTILQSKPTQKAGEKPENFDILVAQNDGLLTDENGRLMVTEQLVLKDGLDLRFGNIDFVGALVVRGDVTPGLSVKADKGIEISGAIRGGKLQCAQGDIVLKGFIFGNADSSIKSRQVLGGRSVHMRVAQQAWVEALGEIRIDKEAYGCTLRSGTSLFMPEGKLIGGECFVVCGVEAKIIGNDVGIKTVINLCSDVESSAEYATLIAEIHNHENAIQLMKLHLGPLATKPELMKRLTPTHRNQMEKLMIKLRSVENSKGELLVKRKKILESARHNPILRVNIHKIAHAGTVIKVADVVHILKEDVKGPASIEYVAERKEFETKPLLPLECTVIPPEVAAANEAKKGAKK